MAPSALHDCTTSPDGKIFCPIGYYGEDTYEAFRKARNITVFFHGHAGRAEIPNWKTVFDGAEQYLARTSLRQLVVKNLTDVRPRAILADSNSARRSSWPACRFHANGTPTSGCQSRGVPATYLKGNLLGKSIFVLHVRGSMQAPAVSTKRLPLAHPSCSLHPGSMKTARPTSVQSRTLGFIISWMRFPSLLGRLRPWRKGCVTPRMSIHQLASLATVECTEGCR